MMTRVAIAGVIVSISLSTLAGALAYRSSELAVDAKVSAEKAMAQVDILGGIASECASNARENNQMLHRMLEHWPK